ncbi:unnamed protein product [Chrysodeixis includens]|uniref:Uncharacterized protein n=1 Tax=Chrysodeixis includens TaxID=689277 RepID=A0A9P0C1E0_CHRIL|nr:unnamed protein product [Chrysodeixis includens]
MKSKSYPSKIRKIAKINNGMRVQDKIDNQCQWVTRTCCKVKNSLMYVTGTVALWAMRRCRESRERAAAAGSIQTRPACPATEYPCQFNADPLSFRQFEPNVPT